MLFGLDTLTLVVQQNHSLLHPTELGHVWENFHGSECFPLEKCYTHLLAFLMSHEP